MPQREHILRALTGYRMRRCSVATMLEFKAVFARFGLRRTTYSALSLVATEPGLRLSQLSELLEIERPNLVQIIDELVASSLVRRKTAEDDRRAIALVATPEGKRLYQMAQAEVAALDGKLTEGLTDEQVEILHQALQLIENKAREIGGDR